MTERPPELNESTRRRLAAAGFGAVPLHHVALGEHPAYGKQRIAAFLATYGYETVLVDDRYNSGPIRSVSLMRIARTDLGRAITRRLELATASG